MGTKYNLFTCIYFYILFWNINEIQIKCLCCVSHCFHCFMFCLILCIFLNLLFPFGNKIKPFLITSNSLYYFITFLKCRIYDVCNFLCCLLSFLLFILCLILWICRSSILFEYIIQPLLLARFLKHIFLLTENIRYAISIVSFCCCF